MYVRDNEVRAGFYCKKGEYVQLEYDDIGTEMYVLSSRLARPNQTLSSAMCTEYSSLGSLFRLTGLPMASVAAKSSIARERRILIRVS